MSLRVFLPAPKSFITQRFGDNSNSSYARDGLKGHTAYDWGLTWGAPIVNCTANAYCYSVMHKDNPDPSQYRAVFMIVDTGDGVYEISYGHCSKMTAEVGKTYQVGDTIALVGNTGDVFSGNHEVTTAERMAGSHAGAHLHGPQIRVLAKTKYTSTYRNYIYDEKGIYSDAQGYFYGIPNYDNGYNGCISMAPFSTETVATAPGIGDILPPLKEVVEEVAKLPASQQPFYIKAISTILQTLKRLIG